MPDSKVVYVNENSDSDDEIIYGEKKPNGTEKENESPLVVQEQNSSEESVVEPAPQNVEVKQEPEPEPEPEPEKVTDSSEVEVVNDDLGSQSNPIDLTGDTDDAESENETGADEAPETVETIDEDTHDDIVDEDTPDDIDDDEDIMSGGYKSDQLDEEDDTDSLDTQAILNVDPLYFRLTKFLQTRGGGPENDEPENVAEILKKINMNLDTMNINLNKFFEMSEKKTSE